MAKLRFLNHLFFFYHYKVSEVYGISSQVKDLGDAHFLLFDIDNTDADISLEWFYNTYKSYRKTFYITHNGFHAIVFKAQSFKNTIKEMLDCPYIDKTWVALGIRRGYFFLQTQIRIAYPNVTYMKVDRIA